MCRTALLAFCWIAGLLPAAAQDASCPPTPMQVRARQVEPDRRDRGVLWRLQKDGRTSWLYGTVPAGRPEWAAPGPRIEAALRSSELLLVEIAPGERPNPDGDRTVRVSEGLERRMERLARKHCVAVPDALTVWSNRSTLDAVWAISAAKNRRLGLYEEYGAPLVIWQWAERQGMPVAGLERQATVDAEYGAIREPDEREFVQRELYAMETDEDIPVETRLYGAWERGDVGVLTSYAEWCGCRDRPAFRRIHERIVDATSERLARRMAQVHAEGAPFFAAIDSVFMSGPKPLHRLLAEHGFQVQYVPLSAMEKQR